MYYIQWADGHLSKGYVHKKDAKKDAQASPFIHTVKYKIIYK